MSRSSIRLVTRESIRARAWAANRGVRIPHILFHGQEHKSCSRCARLKPLSEYSKNTARGDGLRDACKDCEKESR